jgi:predicted NBD/HSP70 family sugar kinase
MIKERTMHPWLFVEIGGSSAQTAQRDTAGRFWFTPGIVRAADRPVALACPGIIRGDRVLYATNLGWPDDADPAHELGLARLALVVNDAEAAALGESLLRAGDRPALDLVYVTLGTGLGIIRVAGGIAIDPDLAHARVGGLYCTGCRNTGCLNALLCSPNLPNPLAEQDQEFIARTLATALRQAAIEANVLLVVGGGMARRYPGIASRLADLMPNPVEGSAAPFEAKSAAYAGLAHLTTAHP